MKKSALYNLSKFIIMAVVILLTVNGVVGSYVSAFDMAKYVMFLNSFAFILGPFMLAIAGGGAWKNFLEKRYQGGDGK